MIRQHSLLQKGGFTKAQKLRSAIHFFPTNRAMAIRFVVSILVHWNLLSMKLMSIIPQQNQFVKPEMIGALLADWEEVIGIELDESYCKIGQARIEFWTRQGSLL